MQQSQLDVSKLRVAPYVRKSTDAEDRQIQSIEDQLGEIDKLASHHGFKPVEAFSESRSAKKPGRPEFNRLIEKIIAGEIDAIVCWKPNRLARNPIDGGQLLWLLQTGQLKAIITPGKVYLPSDNVIPLSVEFAMANQSSLDLGKDVARGMKSKCEKGWRPGLAPLGYLNDKLGEKGEKIIHVDEERFALVRKLWELLLTGNYTVPELTNIANDKLGLRSKKGQKVALGGLYHLFNDRFYYGEFEFDGQVYTGKHKPMITEEEFDRAQKILGRAGRPRPKHKRLPFNGLIKCANCNRMISCDEKVKHVKSANETRRYLYHRCTKRTKDKPCQQPAVSYDSLIEQVTNYLDAIAIPPEFLEWAVQSLREQKKLEETDRNAILRNHQKNYDACLEKLDRLLDTYISSENKDRSVLTEEEFKAKKNTLLKEKAAIEKQIRSIEQRVNEFIDLTIKAFHFATYCKAWFEKGDYETKTQILRALGQTFVLKDRVLMLELKSPYVVMQNAVTDGLFANPLLELARTLPREPEKAEEPAFAATLSKWSGIPESNWRLNLGKVAFCH